MLSRNFPKRQVDEQCHVFYHEQHLPNQQPAHWCTFRALQSQICKYYILESKIDKRVSSRVKRIVTDYNINKTKCGVK